MMEKLHVLVESGWKSVPAKLGEAALQVLFDAARDDPAGQALAWMDVMHDIDDASLVAVLTKIHRPALVSRLVGMKAKDAVVCKELICDLDEFVADCRRRIRRYKP